MFAAFNGHADNMLVFLAHGGDVNDKGIKGKTALSGAEKNSYEEIVLMPLKIRSEE